MIIKEFLLNPIGKDTEGEYVKILNDEKTPVNLNDWSLKDAGGKTYIIKSAVLDPGKELILDYKTTEINLNNNGEAIFLYDPAGKLIDQLSHTGNAPEGKIITKKNSEIFETFPEARGIINPSVPIQQFWLIGFLISLILASLTVYLVKNLPFSQTNEKNI